jgi:hypothetical protein
VNTQGSEFVQHLITDKLASPPEYVVEGYTEKMVYMPHTYYPVGNRATAERAQQAQLGEGPGMAGRASGRDGSVLAEGRGGGGERRMERSNYGLPVRGGQEREGQGQGVERGAVVYGAFNDHYKIDPEVFKVWMRILKQDAGSVLWSLKHGGEDRLLKQAGKHKVCVCARARACVCVCVCVC